ncbi:MAG TPA: K+/H+ antiporter subunit F [Geminicoccaceae bacterium]|nr:K+/H+ antiporter subunit F [Geminicoccaceae bacterium]
MLEISITIGLGAIVAAMFLNLWRLMVGPELTDRILALDTFYINTIALLMLLGIQIGSDIFFEAALLIAMMGFIGTVAFCKYILRGDIIE